MAGLCMVMVFGRSHAQTTITTTGASYTGSNGVGGNSAITFGVNNTNAAAIILTQVATFQNTTNSNNTYTLWYTSSQLTGAPTITAANGWTQVATSAPITVTTSGITTVLSGLNLIIPSNTLYRFALQCSNGVSYSGSSGITPNSFSAGGVDLYTSANTSSVGYGGAFPSPTNTPRAFTGSITFIPATPCSGTPTVGPISPSVVNTCAGQQVSLSVSGYPAAAGLAFQWYNSAGPISGATSPTYSFTALQSNIYKVTVTCTNTSQTVTSVNDTVNVLSPLYGTIPYTESFENWVSRCANTDIPTNNWLNTPPTGAASWRRNDQGVSTAGWASNSGAYSPVSVDGAHSARFNTWNASSGTRGRLDLYLNCSTLTGGKELSFYQINTSGSDSLSIFLSRDGGANFTFLNGWTTASAWTLRTVPIVSDSPRTVIRFEAKSDFGVTDIGVDKLSVVGPCSGKPVAGTIVPVSPCPNTDFNLALQGTSQVAGLGYQWQDSIAGTGGWVTISTLPIPTDNITSARYYRCIVTCTNSGQKDTSAVLFVSLQSFYYCYCSSNATSTADDDIGNVTLKTANTGSVVLNNGVASPLTSNPTSVNTYSDFRHIISPVAIFRDSLYRIFVTQIDLNSFFTCTATAFIDYNRNGVFDLTERLFTKTTSSSSSPAQQVNDTFRVPDTAAYGITGMRVILDEGSNLTINPCGTYTWGETEDYLVDIQFAPCNGPLNAGTAISSDSAMCIGYNLLLTDTTHEAQRSNIRWMWQTSSNNGSSWSVVPSSQNKDTMSVTFNGTSWYRFAIVCDNTGDTTYSNLLKVNIKPAHKCYCYSTAAGNEADSSDIGAMSIGNFVINIGGPHLRNPRAVRGRTDYTDLGPIELVADSVYDLNVYHIMRGQYHADARMTLFMDFNNNLQYDIPAERIPLTNDISTQSGWFLSNRIRIPVAVVPDVPTGMRLIINNNTAPNSPSDDACGGYTSGETEDYTVVFRSSGATGISNISSIRDLAVFPNPTTGNFSVYFKPLSTIKDLKISVTDITGREIFTTDYKTVDNLFSKQMDISSQAKGVYFLQINADGQKTVRKLVLR
ncbi:GEVED domain-containing protein [Chitinophagaceae bacterium MMS25-I14]